MVKFLVLGMCFGLSFVHAQNNAGSGGNSAEPDCNRQMCACGCDCHSPCRCGCVEGKPCNCHHTHQQ